VQRWVRLMAAEMRGGGAAPVLRIMPALIPDPRLTAYVERCTSRPAFKRALDAQMGDFRQAA
jgi:glutathione S-transferase